ncbi:MAG: NUDIX domain-containing protein [Chloroflexota bacterium]
MSNRGQIVTGSLCYVFHEGKVLLLRRNNPPYVGLWSPPGGKLEFGESPLACCIREIHEETGLHITAPQLRVIQTAVDVAVPIHWQLFVYRATLPDDAPATVLPDHAEGELRWFSPQVLDAANRPYADRVYWPAIVGDAGGVWQCTFVYDTPDTLVSETVMKP